MLDPGEIGYATDVRRLFIGNPSVSIGTGNGVLTQFTIPLSLSKPNIVAISVAGTQQSASNYTISGTTITFASAPTGAITANFNSEIDIISDVTLPSSIELAANGSNADTGFQVDTTLYNLVIMDYSLESTSGVRMGQIRFGTCIRTSMILMRLKTVIQQPLIREPVLTAASPKLTTAPTVV